MLLGDAGLSKPRTCDSSALHMASSQGPEVTAEALFAHGVDPTLVDEATHSTSKPSDAVRKWLVRLFDE